MMMMMMIKEEEMKEGITNLCQKRTKLFFIFLVY
jgi:hypothetical protein